MSVEERMSVEGRFPGLKLWLGGLLGVLGISSWLEPWANDQVAGRFPDLTLFVLGRPLLALVFLVIGLQMWSWALQIRAKEALVTGWRWILGLIFLPTLINSLFRFFGFSVRSWPYVAGQEWVFTLLSGGWYPRPFASPGILLTVMVIAWGVGWSVWKWREQKTRALLTAFLTYAAFLLLLSVPSMVAWLGMEGIASWWGASGYAVQRGIIILSNQQYWWRSLYERFPGATGGEAVASEELLFVALAYLFLAGKGFWLFRQELFQRLRTALLPLRGELFLREGVFLATIFFGTFVGLETQAVTVKFFVFTVALLIALVILSAYFFIERGQNSLSEEARWLCWMLLGLGAWLLGWPVAVSLLTALFAEKSRLFFVERSIFPILQTICAGLLWTALFLAAWMFGGHTGSSEVMGTRAFFGFFGFFWVHELVLRIRMHSGEPWPGFLRRGRWVVRGLAVLILLSYVLLPLFTGWLSWFPFALPIGLIAALFTFGREESLEKQLRGTLIAFLVMSYFFLSVRGFHS